MDEFVSIKKAVELTGKSEKTIRRIIKRTLASQEHRQMIRQEKMMGGLGYSINRAYLFEQLKLSVDKGINQGDAQGQTNEQTLSTVLTTLKEQLEEKDRQIQQKDKQISELLERSRESNVLMLGYQSRLGLNPPAQEENKGESTPQQETQQKTEKKGFLARVFGR